jgi:hypothetical protein
MQQDFSQVTFNRDHRRQSAAREAAVGLRYVIAAIALNALALLAVLAMLLAQMQDSGLVSLALFVLMFVAFACGAYGIYSMMDGLGWSGAVSGVLILSTLIPYAKLLVLVVVGVLALNLIRGAGFRFRLFGPLQPMQAAPPPLPPA